MYKAVFKSASGIDRNISISYTIEEIEGDYYIESLLEGGVFHEKAFLGNCGFEKAEELALLLAKNGVHPVHIEDIISDLRF